MKVKLTVFIIFSGLLLGCKKFQLSKSDLEFQPYQLNDTLKFISSKNQSETIIVSDISSHSNPEDNLAVISDYHEKLFVTGKTSNEDFFQRVNLLTMYSDKNSLIEFNFSKVNDSLTYPSTILTLDSLKEKLESLSKEDILNLNDVVKIKAEDYYFDMDFDLENIYWSKKFGYVRYEFNNGYFWELEEFIRAGKNILPEDDSD